MSQNNRVSHQKPGILYIVATPIGNLGDITQRALQVLKKVNQIYAEDTRNTRKLLSHFGLQANLQALHDHNEHQKITAIQNSLDQGDDIALVSDAGTPLISDPGYHLVNELGGLGYTIVPIPGASAIITALSVAGLPTDRFTFEGFLPARAAGKKTALQNNLKEVRTQVYYESSHRITATINAMHEIFGGTRRVVLARELTKLYEQIYRGTLEGLKQWITEDPMRLKGEFVLMLAGYESPLEENSVATSTEHLLTALLSDLPLKQAVNLAVKITGKKKNELYKKAMSLKNRTE